ncbi:MAG TPA: TIGR02206 family membrane protein [Bryobacteraceae bacterium]|nr:TIGR02206 family membrane protein [Bryobacteraceae bacterium]
MRLFGPLHLSLLAAITVIAVLLSWLLRRRIVNAGWARISIGCALAVNEVIWWIFRYSKEGFRFPNNLPLQLCDVAVWTTALACLMLTPWLVEFSYFAGIAGAGMALITPDLWSPWPSYPAIYFFLAHGGIVIAISLIVFGRIAPLRRGALRRGFSMLLIYAAAVGLFDWIFKTNYMYLRVKPKDETLLSLFGPWPVYLIPSFALTLLLFWLLWLAAEAIAQ